MNVCLVGVDMEEDFCPGGALAVPDGDQVIPIFNRLREYALANGWEIVYSKDDHPANSLHFDVNGGQWPVHCLHGTQGAQFHPDLNTDGVLVLVKGTDPHDDGYSIFSGRLLDNGQPLHNYLQRKHIKIVIMGGLATEYCDLASVLDALKLGYTVFVVVDACRAVDLQPRDGERALRQMEAAGAILVSSVDVLGGQIQFLATARQALLDQEGESKWQ